jgi:hypothetical protein
VSVQRIINHVLGPEAAAATRNDWYVSLLGHGAARDRAFDPVIVAEGRSLIM